MAFRLITILILLSFLNKQSNCQSYTPFVIEGATWILYYSDELPNANYWAIKIEGDTLINQNEYKKLYSYDLGTELTEPISFFGNKQYIGSIRENLEQKKVFGILEQNSWSDFDRPSCEISVQENIGNEMLLYDFNIEIGDTLNDCHISDEDYNTQITQIENILVYGEQRNAYSNNNGLKLIEGIGYDDGIFVKAHSWEHAGWGFGLIKYCSGISNDCELTTTTSEIEKEANVIIYPNPTCRTFKIESINEIHKLEVYNIIGQSLNFEKIGSKNFKLNTHLESEVLILKIHTSSAKVETKRLHINCN